MVDPVHDRNICGVAPWTHYVRSPDGQVLAVYHGRQTSENECDPPDSLNRFLRRVHIYPHEYRAYGPDGVNVIFERNNLGAFVKRFVTLNNQGSIVGVTCRGRSSSTSTDNVYAELHDDYGVKTTAITRRTGWLDRELDYETSPASNKSKLYDLDHRKYNASTGEFLSVDPLWAHDVSASPYAYSTANPINLVDPWGLKGGGGSGSGNTENGGGSKPQLGEDNETTTAPVIENSERAEGRLWFERIWRNSLSPGMAWSGSWVAPHPVLTGQNDQRALGPMGFGWKGRRDFADPTISYLGERVRSVQLPVVNVYADRIPSLPQSDAIETADDIWFLPFGVAWETVVLVRGITYLAFATAAKAVLRRGAKSAVDVAAKASTSVIKGFTQHATNQAVTRGFKTADILRIVKEGTPVQVMGRYGAQTRFTLGGNTVVLNAQGKVVTVFSNAPGTANGLGKGFFIPFE